MTSNEENEDDFEVVFKEKLSEIKSEWDERAGDFYDTLCDQIPDMMRTGQHKKTIGHATGTELDFIKYAKKYIETKTNGKFKCEISRGSTHKTISLIAELQEVDEIIDNL